MTRPPPKSGVCSLWSLGRPNPRSDALEYAGGGTSARENGGELSISTVVESLFSCPFVCCSFPVAMLDWLCVFALRLLFLSCCCEREKGARGKVKNRDWMREETSLV